MITLSKTFYREDNEDRVNKNGKRKENKIL